MKQYNSIGEILKNDNMNIKNQQDGTYIINNGQNKILIVDKNVEIIIGRFKLKNEKINILGVLKSTLLKYIKPELFIEKIYCNNEIKREKIDLYETVSSIVDTDENLNGFYRFEYKLDIKDIKKFTFKITFEKEEIKKSFCFNKWAPFNSKTKSYKIYDGKNRIQFKNNEFCICKPRKKTRAKDLKNNIKIYNKIDKKINFFRMLAKLTNNKKNKIWLYYDRRNIFDNAYIQFKHDIKIKDNIKKYYILDDNIENCKDKFDKDELKYVIKFGSIKHKLLFLNSDKILTAFSSLQEYCPFYNNFKYYKDILNYDLIYLQHGILHAKLTRMYAKPFTQIDKIIVSSQFEKNNFINNYEYKKEDLIETGMPRLDNSMANGEPENKIIYAPSWREYLIGKNINRKREINKEKFEKSKYYIEIINFLTDEKLLKALKDKNMIIDFKLHPIFEPYKDCFDKVINENVEVSIGNTDLNKYKAFITDFSSFQFDFVKLKRPIVYFVPDMPEFKSGLHSYRELDLKYEDAFGNLCLKGNELVDEIIKLISNDFKMEPIYEKRMSEFFIDTKGGKDKLYEILKGEN